MATSNLLDLSVAGSDVFRAHLDTEFLILVEGEESIVLVLEEVSDLTDHRAEENRTGRGPFSLVFHCPAGILSQGTHRLSHSSLQDCELFLSPFSDTKEGGSRVEALFT